MQNICAIFDIGKTNKKLLAFNENYEVVYEKQTSILEILDDEGDSCDDLMALNLWIKKEFEVLKSIPSFVIKALNFSGYGASLVYLDQNGNTVGPIYNYLKNFPTKLKEEFWAKYNADHTFFKTVASPDLGMLNSGMQLYWLKNNKTDLFKITKYALHFPQYLSFIFSKLPKAEFTSIGCHTGIWDFENWKYHEWLEKEHIHAALLPPVNAKECINLNGLCIGPGIHDSSAALVPYLKTNSEPFVLISTGTWCISINPFNEMPLTDQALKSDCLNFISFEGKSVRASRLFSGNEHGRQVKHLSEYFGMSEEYYKSITFNYKTVQWLRRNHKQVLPEQTELGNLKDCPFVERNLNAFRSFDEAYHQFVMDLVAQQIASTKLTIGIVLPKKIFVDGGFSKNEIFMSLLAEAFFNVEVYASEVAQASSLGAAMVISENWTNNELAISALKLKRFF